MAKIAAFRGYRYNKMMVGDLNKVVAQPYDQIGDELRADYHQRSEHNVVRIIKGIPTELDTPNDNVYTRAAGYWEEWIEDRVLTREPGPAIYPYFQEYTVEGKTFVRKGLIALVDLADKNAKVKAHEHTHSGPKADRLRLMKATEANDGQIFMLYNDAEQKVNNIIDQQIIGAQPIMTVKDDFGATHRLYRISSPSAVADIAEVFEDLELFIADGHHRYETAVNYMNYCKDRKWAPDGIETFTHRMMTMVNMHDPGLSVLPTHRLIHSLDKFTLEKFLSQAESDFEITDYADLDLIAVAMDNAVEAGKTVFGFAAVGMTGLKLLTLKDPGLMDKLVGDAHCPAWRKLDVTVLHTALLDRLLGIGTEALEKETNVRYVRGRAEALATLGKNGIQAVFLINATRVSQVGEVASAGERMPQKSTDFFPKLLTGMVMMKMKIDKSLGLALYEADL